MRFLERAIILCLQRIFAQQKNIAASCCTTAAAPFSNICVWGGLCYSMHSVRLSHGFIPVVWVRVLCLADQTRRWWGGGGSGARNNLHLTLAAHKTAKLSNVNFNRVSHHRQKERGIEKEKREAVEGEAPIRKCQNCSACIVAGALAFANSQRLWPGRLWMELQNTTLQVMRTQVNAFPHTHIPTNGENSLGKLCVRSAELCGGSLCVCVLAACGRACLMLLSGAPKFCCSDDMR